MCCSSASVILHINIGGVRTNYAAFLILHGDPLAAAVRRPGMDSISRGWARLVTRRKVLSIKNTIPLMIITPPSPTTPSPDLVTVPHPSYCCHRVQTVQHQFYYGAAASRLFDLLDAPENSDNAN